MVVESWSHGRPTTVSRCFGWSVDAGGSRRPSSRTLLPRCRAEGFAIGRELLANAPERGRLLVQVAVVQPKFWRTTAETLRERAPHDGRGANLNHVAGWSEPQRAEHKTTAGIAALLRHSFPFDRADLFPKRVPPC
jgi:hypothetical protein